MRKQCCWSPSPATRSASSPIPASRTPSRRTGDLFSARLAGWMLAGEALFDAVERVSREVVETLERTRRLGWEELALVLPVPASPRD